MSTEPGRGSPRMQYKRTYILLPPSANSDWALAAIGATWDDHRYTVGASADDAGVGSLDVRNIIAVNPGEWGDLGAFYAEHYPGVSIEYVHASTPEQLGRLLSLPTPEPPPPTPDTHPTHPITGIHDLGGAAWMVANGIRGWCCESVYLDGGPLSLDLQHLADAGIRVVLRMNWSYATDDGGSGTIPSGPQLPQWESNAVETMRRCKGVWGYAIGNEMNNSREWPDGVYLSPDEYAATYNRIYDRRPDGARVSPGAIDPTNAGWGDWRKTWPLVLESLHGAEFLAVHAYDHGPNADRNMVFGDPPLEGAFYNLRMLETQKAIIPARFTGLPVVITETNHLYRGDEETDQGWEDNAGGWVTNALDYFARQGVAGVTAYRWGYDRWAIEGNESVKNAIKDYAD